MPASDWENEKRALFLRVIYCEPVLGASVFSLNAPAVMQGPCSRSELVLPVGKHNCLRWEMVHLHFILLLSDKWVVGASVFAISS